MNKMENEIKYKIRRLRLRRVCTRNLEMIFVVEIFEYSWNIMTMNT